MNIEAEASKIGDIDKLKKEDFIPITMKVTKRVPYYDWTIHQLRFCTGKEVCTLRIPFKDWVYDYDVLYYIKNQGVDITSMDVDMWNDFRGNGDRYKAFREWINQQWEDAKNNGSSYLRYTYRKRHLDGIWWEVTIILHMFGEERKVKYVASCRYEKTPSEETMHNYVFDLLRDTLGRYESWHNMSKETWDNDDTFKKLFENGRRAIEGYNSGELQRNSCFL